jgi:hypothetical protein
MWSDGGSSIQSKAGTLRRARTKNDVNHIPLTERPQDHPAPGALVSGPEMPRRERRMSRKDTKEKTKEEGLKWRKEGRKEGRIKWRKE